MCSWKRISIVLLTGCLIAAYPGMAEDDSLERQKRLAIESVLAGSVSVTDPAAIVDAALQAYAIERVEYDSAASALSIGVAGTPAVHWVFIKSTNRLAIDVYDAVNLVAGRPIEVGSGTPVESIRTSIFKLEPQIISRIVLQMTGPVTVNLDDTNPGQMVFTFAGESADTNLPAMPESEPAAESTDVDAIVASLENEFDAQLVLAAKQRERLVTMFDATRVAVAERQETLKTEAESKEYPVKLGYLVLLADHEALLGGHLGEIAGEQELIMERVEMARAEMHTVLNSDFDDKGLTAELNSFLEAAREAGQLDKGRFEQILNIATDEQMVALSAAENLAQKIADAPNVAEEIDEVMVANADTSEAVFEVADDATVGRIDELMELALADESANAESADVIQVSEPEVVAGDAEILATADTEEALNALDSLTAEMSLLRSHPAAKEQFGEINEMPLLAMNIPTAATFSSDAQADALEQVELAPVVLDGAQTEQLADGAGQGRDSAEGSRGETGGAKSLQDSLDAVGGPEVDVPGAGVAAEVTEASPVTVEEAEAPSANPGVVAARASAGADTGQTPQVMAQATPGQPEVITTDSLNTPMERPNYDGDPMDQPVSIEFRDELLRNIIGLLAQKAGVNVIGGGTLGDITVSANMRDVPLRQAMNMLLRLEDFGMVEEEGVYRIVPYELALQLRRVTRMVPLRNAQANEVETTLNAITSGSSVDQQVMVAANKTANVVVLSGPLDRVEDLEQLVYSLDIAEPTLPTITESIRLNYAEPDEVKSIIESLLTTDGEQQIGKVESDIRGRSVVVTDLPVVVEQVRALVKDIDYPVQQVNIDSMVVDVVLTDDAATGVDWFVNLLRRTNSNGEIVGNLSSMQGAADFGGSGGFPGVVTNPVAPLGAGVLSFGILSSDFDIQGVISAEVQNSNAEILANPNLVTLENQPAQIEIISEFPYRELTQTEGGGQIASTEFKNIGTTLEVTPRVTADEDILVSIFVEQSQISGFSENVPVTNNRRATTNVRTDDRQTIFIGGLRRMDDTLDVRKVPVLGDIPVISPLFRTTTSNKQNTDLLIFVTCQVLGERAPDLSGSEQRDFDRIEGKPEIPDAQREVLRTWAKPNEMRDPIWKWRRSK